MNTHAINRYGALARRPLRPRPRTPTRNDTEHLFSNPVNAARLRRAIDDSIAGRNMIRMTLEEFEASYQIRSLRARPAS